MPARSALALTLLLAAGLAGYAQDQPRNVVVNSSLEDPVAGTGLPEGWWPFADPPDSYRIAVVAGGRTGDKALLVEGDGQVGGFTTTRVPVEPGKRYLARGWVKIEGDPEAKATVQVGFSDADGGYLGSTWLGNVSPAPGRWQFISVPAHADDVAGAASACAAVSVIGKAKVWFDDLELVVADGPVPGDNLITNGNVEDVVEGAPVYWIPFTEPGAVATLTAGEDAPEEGAHCLCLKGDAQYIVGLGETYAIDPAKTYTLRGFVRAKAGDALLQIEYCMDEQHLGNTESAHVTRDEWEERSVTTDFASFPDATHFRVCVAAATGAVEAYFDDLRLVEE